METVDIKLSKAACLILFELLNFSYEQWLEMNTAGTGTMIIEAPSAARAAFAQLEGAIERTLPELFSNKYRELLEESERLLSEQG